jgi:hypothetical protein
MKERERANPRPKRKPFVTNAELIEELTKWRDSNKDVSKRRPSERLGKMILDIATHYMGHPDYVRYSKEIKEDIISESCVKIINYGLPKYNFSFTNPFAYFTQICWSCAMTYLKNYYNDLNFKRKLVVDTLEQAKAEMPTINIDKSYMEFLKTMIGSDQITEQDAKFLRRQKDAIISEINASTAKKKRSENGDY